MNLPQYNSSYGSTSMNYNNTDVGSSFGLGFGLDFGPPVPGLGSNSGIRVQATTTGSSNSNRNPSTILMNMDTNTNMDISSKNIISPLLDSSHEEAPPHNNNTPTTTTSNIAAEENFEVLKGDLQAWTEVNARYLIKLMQKTNESRRLVWKLTYKYNHSTSRRGRSRTSRRRTSRSPKGDKGGTTSARRSATSSSISETREGKRVGFNLHSNEQKHYQYGSLVHDEYDQSEAYKNFLLRLGIEELDSVTYAHTTGTSQTTQSVSDVLSQPHLPVANHRNGDTNDASATTITKSAGFCGLELPNVPSKYLPSSTDANTHERAHAHDRFGNAATIHNEKELQNYRIGKPSCLEQPVPVPLQSCPEPISLSSVQKNELLNMLK